MQDLGFGLKGKRAKHLVTQVVAKPDDLRRRPDLGQIWPPNCSASEARSSASRSSYRTWGTDIDAGAHAADAKRLPRAECRRRRADARRPRRLRPADRRRAGLRRTP